MRAQCPLTGRHRVCAPQVRALPAAVLRGVQHPAPAVGVQPDPQPAPINQPAFSFDNLYPNMNNNSSTEPTKPVNDPIVKPLEIIEENKTVNNPTTDIPQEPKSPRKEMVAVQNEDDIDETSSLANFFDDMKKIVEDKGIKVEKNDNKMFTLFEDANEVEK